jgi:hypothetical protein
MIASPSHGFRPFDSLVDAVEDSAVPMLFCNASTMLNRVVFAVVGRIQSVA